MPTSAYLWDQQGPRDDTSVAGYRSGAQWRVHLDAGESVELRVGVGPARIEQARAHVASIRDQSLEEVRAAAKKAWLEKLNRIVIASDSSEHKEIFYSTMMRLWQMPTQWQGEDGVYVTLDGEAYQGEAGHQYLTNLSLWDTFRTLNPLYVLIDAPLARDVLQSLLIMGEAGGTIPRWPAGTSYTGGMVGFSAAHLFAEGIQKGIDDIDYDAAFNLFLQQVGDQQTAETPSSLNGLAAYQTLGYIPMDRYGHSVATTLEYARAYASLAELAQQLQRKEEAFLRTQADAWKNLFHPAKRFFRPRLEDGRWSEAPPDHTVNMSDGPYTEGSAWQYRFYAMQALDAFVELWGDTVDMTEQLEILFEQSAALHDPDSLEHLVPGGYYWHGNEPDIDAPYVFHALGQYDRVNHWVRTIQDTLYETGPEGLPGNDDGGTLSAWYVWNAIGLYPMVGTDRYMLGMPLFPHIEIRLDDDATLTILAPDLSESRRSLTAVRLNDVPLEGYQVSHRDLRNATLTFLVE